MPGIPARRVVAAILCSSVVFLAHASAQPSFTPLGFLNPDRPYTEAWGIARQSRAAVGFSQIAGGGFSPINAAFIAEPGAPITLIYDASSTGGTARAYAASDDAATIVGTVDFGYFSPDGTQAYIWTSATGPLMIGDLPGGASMVPRSSARAVSGDGLFIAGTGESDSGNEAFLYSISTSAFTPLGDLPGGVFGSFATGISGDGSTIVGSSTSGPGETQAFRWTAPTGMIGLGFMPTPPSTIRYSQAEAISGDGQVIVGEGRSMNSPNGGEACRWTAAGGSSPSATSPGALSRAGPTPQTAMARSSSDAPASTARAASSAAAQRPAPSSGTGTTACATFRMC